VEICYDFEGAGVTSTRLRITFTLASGGSTSSEEEVSTSDKCCKVDVPADAETILVEDLDGPSPDKASSVENG